ncbi:MAG TPA: nitroreductase family protein [Candidatus Avamphibacillus intestinigallinarum]|nr:nitroreductase family protein [Candidatus Avamphibacillus intestinigallinarum]
MDQHLQETILNRRSIYAIGKDSPVSDEKIEEMVAFAIKHTPTAFNSQTGRVVLLLGKEHEALWDLTEAELRKVSSQTDFTATEQKMAAFKNGYGTVLFFEDNDVVKGLQEKFPGYADKFPDYALQSSGILQYIIWTTFAKEGLGATVQHYSPVIDQPVQEKWDIPENWQLIAQMPFGNVLNEAGEKEFAAVEDRLKVFKA